MSEVRFFVAACAHCGRPARGAVNNLGRSGLDHVDSADMYTNGVHEAVVSKPVHEITAEQFQALGERRPS